MNLDMFGKKMQNNLRSKNWVKISLSLVLLCGVFSAGYFTKYTIGSLKKDILIDRNLSSSNSAETITKGQHDEVESVVNGENAPDSITLRLPTEYDYTLVCDFVGIQFNEAEYHIFQSQKNNVGVVIDKIEKTYHSNSGDVYRYTTRNIGYDITSLHREFHIFPDDRDFEDESVSYVNRSKVLKRFGIKDNFGTTVNLRCEAVLVTMKFNKNQLISVDMNYDFESVN